MTVSYKFVHVVTELESQGLMFVTVRVDQEPSRLNKLSTRRQLRPVQDDFKLGHPLNGVATHGCCRYSRSEMGIKLHPTQYKNQLRMMILKNSTKTIKLVDSATPINCTRKDLLSKVDISSDAAA